MQIQTPDTSDTEYNNKETHETIALMWYNIDSNEEEIFSRTKEKTDIENQDKELLESIADKSSVLISFNVPPKFPIGVLTASIIYVFIIINSNFYQKKEQSL